jgi:hypothetical protein
MPEIKPISIKKSFPQIYGENLKKAYTHDWIFSSWYEKLIVLGSFIWAVWNILLLLWSLL